MAILEAAIAAAAATVAGASGRVKVGETMVPSRVAGRGESSRKWMAVQSRDQSREGRSRTGSGPEAVMDAAYLSGV